MICFGVCGVFSEGCIWDEMRCSPVVELSPSFSRPNVICVWRGEIKVSSLELIPGTLRYNSSIDFIPNGIQLCLSVCLFSFILSCLSVCLSLFCSVCLSA